MKAVIFDTETTGLIENRTLTLDKQPEVIEFYGCVADLATGEVLSEFETLIKPANYPITERVLKETKSALNNDMLKDAPTFKYVAPNIAQILDGADSVIAHNLSFDMEMIDIEFERLGLKVDWPWDPICTVEQTLHLTGYRLNLTNLHKHLFDEPFPDAHRAKADVHALLRCCVELFKRDVF